MRFEDLVSRFDPELLIMASGGQNARGKCPAHDGKTDKSLSITKGANGTALVHCFGGCTVEAVLAAVGVDPAEFYSGAGCSLEKFSAHTGIPEVFLKQRGLSDGFFRYGKNNRIPAVVIPYLKEDGTPDTSHYRINLSGDKWRWKTGSKAKNKLFGAEHLAQLEPKSIIVVEGESDALTLAYSGFQAVGLPGAGLFDGKVLAERLVRFEAVYFIIEPDAGGETVLKRLHGAGDAILDKVRFNRRGRTLWILIGSICKSNLGGRIKSTENCFLDGRLFPCLKPLIRCPGYATKLSQNLDLRERGLLDKKDRIEIGLNPRVRIADRKTLCLGFCWPGAMRLKKIGVYLGIGESGVG